MTDQFEPAYRTLVVACKSDKRWFDLDAVRTEWSEKSKSNLGYSSMDRKAAAGPDVDLERRARNMPTTEDTNGGAPPLDYWLIDTQAGVDRVLKSMLPERVCRVCGEPSRRIVGETTYSDSRGYGSMSLHMQDGKRAADGVNQWKGAGANASVIADRETLGWTDCGHDDWRGGVVLDPFDLTTKGQDVGQARYIIGDVFDTLATLPDNSVDLVFSSPPFLALRSYLPADHPDKGKEIGSEATPADFLDTLLDVVEACDRVLAPHGSLCFELGDTYSGSGGAGGDYGPAGLREGQPGFDGSAARTRTPGGDERGSRRLNRGDGPPPRRRTARQDFVGDKQRKMDDRKRTFRSEPRDGYAGGGDGWPLPKSLCGIPTLFAWSLAYGRNLLRPERTTPRWRIRNVIVWARPNPPVGALGDKFRPATSYLTVACKSDKRWFDLDAVRTAVSENSHGGGTWTTQGGAEASIGEIPKTLANPAGAPPLDYWEIPTQPYAGSHYATFPSKLATRPVKSMCPSRVCKICGEPSRRITTEQNNGSEREALAAHLTAQREAKGLTRKQVAAHFPSVTGGLTGCVTNWESNFNVPTAEQWPVLKELLDLSDEFDAVITGERAWTESSTTYEELDGTPAERAVWTSGVAEGKGAHSNKPNGLRAVTNTLGWTDCGHNDYRNGVVLDPFAGSGTTLSVATGHGRDAIGIDLDARNAELALERVGPLFLTVEELGDTAPFAPPPEDVETEVF